MPKILRRPHQ
uniref:SYMRK n=1 Tax=Arundo donax TaxID=35708 RepID=A0A0A9C305_ARUDO